jgi:hypothetical protein
LDNHPTFLHYQLKSRGTPFLQRTFDLNQRDCFGGENTMANTLTGKARSPASRIQLKLLLAAVVIAL